MLFLYQLGLFIWLCISCCFQLRKLYTNKEYRHFAFSRLNPLKGINQEFKNVIWIQAVSLGESKAALTLAESIRRKQPETQFVFATHTQTGFETLLKGKASEDLVIAVPLDLRWVVRRVLNVLKPLKIYIMENDLWPVFIDECRRHSLPIFIVNAKLSEKSYRLYRRISSLFMAFYSEITYWYVQDETYYQRLIKLGVANDKITVSGNLKFDKKVSDLSLPKRRTMLSKLSLEHQQKVVLVASTHQPEEVKITSALMPLIENQSIKLLIAPRHPIRFSAVKKTLVQSFPNIDVADLDDDKPCDVLVINRIGLLDQYFPISDLVIVAGSFEGNVGGHNLLEPLYFKTPVIFGPYTYNQPGMTKLIKDYSAGHQVRVDELYATVKNLINNRKEYQKLLHHSASLLENLQGVAEKISEHSLKTVISD